MAERAQDAAPAPMSAKITGQKRRPEAPADPMIMKRLIRELRDIGIMNTRKELGIVFEVVVDVDLGRGYHITVPEVRNFTVCVLKLDGSASFIQPMEPTRPLFVADGEEFGVLHEFGGPGSTLITGAVKLQDRIEITGALSVGGKKFHASPWTADHSSR